MDKLSTRKRKPTAQKDVPTDNAKPKRTRKPTAKQAQISPQNPTKNSKQPTLDALTNQILALESSEVIKLLKTLESKKDKEISELKSDVHNRKVTNKSTNDNNSYENELMQIDDSDEEFIENLLIKSKTENMKKNAKKRNDMFPNDFKATVNPTRGTKKTHIKQQLIKTYDLSQDEDEISNEDEQNHTLGKINSSPKPKIKSSKNASSNPRKPILKKSNKGDEIVPDMSYLSSHDESFDSSPKSFSHNVMVHSPPTKSNKNQRNVSFGPSNHEVDISANLPHNQSMNDEHDDEDSHENVQYKVLKQKFDKLKAELAIMEKYEMEKLGGFHADNRNKSFSKINDKHQTEDPICKNIKSFKTKKDTTDMIDIFAETLSNSDSDVNDSDSDSFFNEINNSAVNLTSKNLKYNTPYKVLELAINEVSGFTGPYKKATAVLEDPRTKKPFNITMPKPLSEMTDHNLKKFEHRIDKAKKGKGNFPKYIVKNVISKERSDSKGTYDVVDFKFQK